VKGTAWDIGLTIEVTMPEGENASATKERWIDRRARELGVQPKKETSVGYDIAYFSGGQTKLEGQSYFRFFTVLMLIFAVAYVPFAMLYRPKSYLPDA
jgi:POT family proton-dependent oligopeptide transporter